MSRMVSNSGSVSGNELTSKFRRILGLPLMLLSLVLVFWGILHFGDSYPSPVSQTAAHTTIFTGCLLICFGISLVEVVKKRLMVLRLLFGSVSAAFLIFLMVFQILVGIRGIPSRMVVTDGSFGVFNEPCAYYDGDTGYRWKSGTHRLTKTAA